VFFSGGCGFRVLLGDATNPPAGEVWHPLGFEHDETDHSSYLTNALQHPTLFCHRTDQVWARMLLPDIYHGPLTTDLYRGSLKGELPIFLALLALAMPPTELATYLPSMFQGGVWRSFDMAHGRAYPQ
jgi:hypothetical protein